MFCLTLDIDECEAGTSDCQQICINTPGRFRCECTAGYVLDDDRRTCLDGKLLLNIEFSTAYIQAVLHVA